MPVIESSIEIKASLDKIWDTAMRVEEFPEFMPDVRSLKVLERSADGLRTVTEWVGEVREFKTTVKWIEEDIWNPADHSCEFRMIKGDMQKYEGKWSFTPNKENGTVRFHSIIEFEYDVPLIGPLIRNIISSKMKQNAENILKNIKEKAESI